MFSQNVNNITTFCSEVFHLDTFKLTKIKRLDIIDHIVSMVSSFIKHLLNIILQRKFSDK